MFLRKLLTEWGSIRPISFNNDILPLATLCKITYLHCDSSVDANLNKKISPNDIMNRTIMQDHTASGQVINVKTVTNGSKMTRREKFWEMNRILRDIADMSADLGHQNCCSRFHFIVTAMTVQEVGRLESTLRSVLQ